MAGTGVVIPEKSIHFADCELNAAAFELRRGRRTVKLERIPLQVLLILIEERDKVVAREAIAQQIWGKDVFVDVDNGINTAIRKIRQVLNDDPQKPRFVETTPGVGYRFIAPMGQSKTRSRQNEPVHEQPASPTIVATKNTESAVAHGGSVSNRRALWIRSGVAVFALLCVVGIVGWLSWKLFNEERHTIRSIAVLPFQNLSGDPSQDYFSDGMTEELITELSRIEPLRVISHTSVMDYKGTKKHLPEIARELGVEAILEGSVIRENNTVRVTVQLLDGPADRHLWGEEYERSLNGILNLQKDVARSVAQEVRAKLTPEQQARFGTAQEINPKAYENYPRGRYLMSTEFSMREPLLQAKTYFENAIQEDPKYAEAYPVALSTAGGRKGIFWIATSRTLDEFVNSRLRKLRIC